MKTNSLNASVADPIIVTVVDNTIVCQPDCKTVQMGKGDVHVTWSLQTPGYQFLTSDTVVMKDLPNPNFPDAVTYIGPLSVSLKDCCHSKDTFSYTIYVQNSATQEVLSLDPEIENQNLHL